MLKKIGLGNFDLSGATDALMMEIKPLDFKEVTLKLEGLTPLEK